MIRGCSTRHAGPFRVVRDGGAPVELLSNGGGSSCLVGLNGPSQDAAGNDINYQGLIAKLSGMQGSTWVPLRLVWAPAFSIGARQLIQYQGAAVQQFRVELSLTSSGFTPSSWASEISSLHASITNGDAGSGGVAPGGTFLLTSRVSVMPAGDDFPSVSASPERRRITLELLSTTAPGGVGFSWNPADAGPGTWVPLAVGVPRTMETTAPIWIASDPPGLPSEISVIEELG